MMRKNDLGVTAAELEILSIDDLDVEELEARLEMTLVPTDSLRPPECGVFVCTINVCTRNS